MHILHASDYADGHILSFVSFQLLFKKVRKNNLPALSDVMLIVSPVLLAASVGRAISFLHKRHL